MREEKRTKKKNILEQWEKRKNYEKRKKVKGKEKLTEEKREDQERALSKRNEEDNLKKKKVEEISHNVTENFYFDISYVSERVSNVWVNSAFSMVIYFTRFLPFSSSFLTLFMFFFALSLSTFFSLSHSLPFSRSLTLHLSLALSLSTILCWSPSLYYFLKIFITYLEPSTIFLCKSLCHYISMSLRLSHLLFAFSTPLSFYLSFSYSVLFLRLSLFNTTPGFFLIFYVTRKALTDENSLYTQNNMNDL